MVAQVDEQQPAVVADAMHPAGQADGLADVGGAERAAGVASIAVHRNTHRKTPGIGPQNRRFRRPEKRMEAGRCQGYARWAGLLQIGNASPGRLVTGLKISPSMGPRDSDKPLSPGL